MLNWWNALELFDKWLIAIMAVGLLILAFCVYKIAKWFQKEEVVARINTTKLEKQSHELYPLLRKINIHRTWLVFSFCIAIIIASVLLSYFNHPWLTAAVPFVGLAACFLINNHMVTSRWRCPACSQPLPRKIGRSSLRPHLAHTCPSCGRNFQKTTSQLPY